MSELALAFSAGLIAAFNPCGFALLPAYLASVLSAAGSVVRAVRLALAMTAGFIAIFGLFGLVVAPLALSIGDYLPWATIVIGVALTALGGWLLSGRELLVRVPQLSAERPRSHFVYGMSYAVASLSCTIGPFLAVISTSFSADGVPGALAIFIAYGAGMGLIVGLLSVAVALARTAMVARMRRAMPYVSRASGALLVVAGLYIVYYGWYELRVFSGGSPDDPVIGTALAIQGAITAWLESLFG